MKNFLFVLLVHIVLLNCATRSYTNSHRATDADSYISMTNEYNSDAEARFIRQELNSGSQVILKSSSILIPPPDSTNRNSGRVLTINIQDNKLNLSDKISNESIMDKSNVLFFHGFDTERLYKGNILVQKENSLESDLVDIERDTTIFIPLEKNDKIQVKLGKSNAYKYSYNSLEVYQIFLEKESTIYYWKLNKTSGQNQYIVDRAEKYTGKADIQYINRSRAKYLGSKFTYYAGYTGAALLDVLTFPLQLPYLILQVIGVTSGAR